MGTRSKEAIVILVDAGPSMRTPLRERASLASELKFKNDPTEKTLTTRFDAAVAAVESIIQQKLFFKPKDELGIVLYGTEETDNQLNDDQGDGEYTNVSVLSSIDTPSLSVCDKLRKLSPSPAESEIKVDLLDGLIVALDLLYRRTDGKKYDKRLLVITDAAAKINDASDVESVVQMIQSMDVKLQIVGIDFRHTTDKEVTTEESVVKAEQTPTEDVQIKTENEKMLVSIAKEVQGDVASASKRMHLLAQGMKKTVSQVTKFRGPLEIGPNFGIPLYCYLKTKTATLPTLSKESQVSHDKDNAGKVRMDRRYTSPQNPDDEIAPDQQVKAYRYGQERVPFSAADVDSFKFQTEKSLKLLGFVEQSQLNWSKFIGGTDIFIAEPGKPNAAQALAALVEGMLDLGHAAVARFVARKNASPKIIALIPHKPTPAENYYALWGQQLPYEEDVRTYEFAPLKTKKYTPNDQQQALADKLVESLSVKDDKADEFGTCFNPVLRRFYHAVEQRAFNDNATIPPIPSYLERSLKMDEIRQHKIEDIIQSFGDAFQLKEAVKKQSDRKKKSFWSDIPSDVKMEGNGNDANADDDAEGAGDAGGDGDDAGSDIDLDDLLDGADVTTVGAMNPIADFETLVDLGKSNKQKLRAAVTGMQTQITSFFQSGNSAFYPKALQCLAHFRKRSTEIHYASEFNTFLVELKTSVGGSDDPVSSSPAWKAIQHEGITLLTSQDDPSVTTTPAQARVFLHGDEIKADPEAVAASLSSQVQEIEAEDDMFADFE